jgi:hypothetical protein
MMRELLYYRSSCYSIYTVSTNENIDYMTLGEINTFYPLDLRLANPGNTQMSSQIMRLNIVELQKEHRETRDILWQLLDRMAVLLNFYDVEIRELESIIISMYPSLYEYL